MYRIIQGSVISQLSGASFGQTMFQTQINRTQERNNKIDQGINEELKKEESKCLQYLETNFSPFNSVTAVDIETTNNGLNGKGLTNTLSLNFETDHIL